MSMRSRCAFAVLLSVAMAAGCGNEARSGDGLTEDGGGGADGGGGDAGVDDVSIDLGPGPDVDVPDEGVDTVDPPDIGTDTISPPDIGTDTVDPPDIGTDTIDPPDVEIDVIDPPDTGCVDECRAPGPNCAGDLLQTCARGADGCLDLTTVDCAATFGTTCDPDTLTCAGDDPRPCDDRETCAVAGRSCDGDTLVVCSRDADGCIVPAEVPCDVLGQTCVESGATAACQDPTDPCLGECPAPSYCGGGAAITCEPDADGCLVEVSRDACAASDRGCALVDGVAVCTDACTAIDTCDPDAYVPSCDGAVYLSCGPDRDGCFVEQGQNCAFRRGGFCDADEGCLIDLCGDGEIDTDIGETCDDGNRTGRDGCSTSCTIEDGYVCAGEPSTCTTLECGDDIVAFGEGCEDGNTRAGDGCSPSCLLEIPDRGESLSIDGALIDLGATWVAPNGGCTAGPTFETPFEATWWTNDTGETQSVTVSVAFGSGTFLEVAVFEGSWLPGQEPAGCIDVSPFGGGAGASLEDIPVAPGETLAIIVSQSFAGTPSEFPDYTLTVTSAGCGDGRIQRELGEVCDDGGAEPGDGCSASCTLEDGFACRGEPSECYAFECGDGLVDPDIGEDCDDGGTEPGDGCAADCTLEDGAFCYGEPSICINPVCGDDIIDLGEGCEDGNLTNGDGCNDRCQLEIPASGESIEITDAFTGTEERYTRPGQGPGCGGGFGGSGSYPWRAWTWVNTSDVEQVVDIVAAWPADGFLFVYDGGFNPEEPTDGCLFGNDDDGGIRGSALRNIPVRAGGTITIVASSFSATGFTGAFSITVTAR